MKASKYNLFVNVNNHWFAYNQLTRAILEADEELKEILQENRVEKIPEDLMKDLEADGFVCPNDLNEANIILAKNKMSRFNNPHARVTIMPTLNCNFSCWYCYEHHHESVMSQENAARTIAFCKKMIESNSISSFQLDWFGGEPLLYFDEIVYPISVMIQETCAETGIKFINTITTNGYLIDDARIEKMEEINLRSFQITLDGGEKFHNRTRFSKEDKQSYTTITRNITKLCQRLEPIDMTVRINYTPKNFQSIDSIANVFPDEVRGKIGITPQIVWQFKNGINEMTDSMKDKMDYFIQSGYRKAVPTLGCTQCYTENMKQFVVNYDLKVYKCTARDFKSENAIGHIDAKGDFIPLPHYYDYFTASGMEHEDCQACALLPSCLGTCIQKKVEGYRPPCNPQQIRDSILNNLRLYLKLMQA